MESGSAWIAFAALMVTILTVSGGGLWALFSRMDTNKNISMRQVEQVKQSFDTELEVIRLAAYTEYKELRREMNDGWGKAYLEFGEAPKALREKISQVELFMRDTYVPFKIYERGQDQVLETIRAFASQSEKKFDMIEKKLDKLAERKTENA